MRTRFPEISHYGSFFLDVGDGHKLYVEESGNPNGIPIIYCHGGPGAGSHSEYRRFYNPEKYRIILFDQRGCGLSTPHCAEDINAIWHNTTSDLVKDLEKIRLHLGIESWVVTGGSWGTTLALMYAIEFPERTLGLILRGVFLGRKQDIHWLFDPNSGASQVYPEFYRQFVQNHNHDTVEMLLDSYYELLTGDNDLTQLAAAKQFIHWEGQIAKLKTTDISAQLSNKEAIAMALLNCHYFINDCFMYESEIISEINRINDIPGVIVHGRFDMVCKVEAAHTLAQSWQNGKLEIIPEAGHSASEIGIIDALVRASDDMAAFL